MERKSCCYSDRLLSKLLTLNEQAEHKVDIDEVKKAIYYAKKYHGDQKRQSGEPYYSHPLEVAYMVSDHLFRTDVLVTAILHDTIEDTELTKEMIADIFGESVADKVNDLTRIKEDGRKISSAEMVNQLYQQKKHDVLMIKLFDRLHNTQTADAEKTEKIIKEAWAFFALSACMKKRDVEEMFTELLLPFAQQQAPKAPFEVVDSQILSLICQNNLNQT